MAFGNSAGMRAVLAASSAMYLLAGAPAAMAQDTQAAEDDDMIVVTGSRIQRRDYEANSPIVTAGAELLRNSGTAAIETALNKLPAFTPVQTPALGGDIQSTATNTPGAATVSLRGLGTNRNLVLVNGRRATPANALGVVDINTIPAMAIDRVEIITGGASATYGADAVGGVVNFILKDNFEGLAFDSNMAISQEGDGFEYLLSGMMGANFDDGRGNIMMGLSTNVRETAFARNRDYQIDVWQDPRFVGTEFFPDFSGFQPTGGINPTQASYDALFGAGAVGAGSRLYFNDDGTAFTGFFQSPPGGANRFNGDLSDPKFKRLADGSLGQNFTETYTALPLTRYNMFARGNYEINDWIGVFAQGIFTDVSTSTIQQPSPSVNGWSALAPSASAVPAELRGILDSRVIPVGAGSSQLAALNCDPNAVPGAPGSGASCDWQLTYYLDYADREATTNVNTYDLVAGFEGSVPGTDWTWEAFVSHGVSSTFSQVTGIASLERLRAVIGSPNWGAGFRQQGNAAFGGFGASSGTCTSGIDPFDLDQQISEDCIEAISANLTTRARMQQTVVEFNAQGGLFDLPAGLVRGSVGATYRENNYEFLNDTLTTQGRSFQDQAVGLFPSGNSEGTIDVHEIYGELLIPVISDVPGIQSFELNLGARQSDYNTIGGNFTWKAMADWEVTDFLRLRGGYNRAVRAPNIAELFLAPQQTFTAAGGGDVCRLNNSLSYSANPTANGNSANVQAVCRILMDQTIDGTADVFYSDPQFFNAVGPAFAFPTLVGNNNVQAEQASTWTIGAVVNSPFYDSALFGNFRFSVDYYNIAVDNAIGPQTLDTAQRSCFDPTFNPAIANDPTAAAAVPFCQAIGRVAGDGALGNVQVTYLNTGRFRTEGIDAQFDWSAPVGPGTVNLNSVFNYLLTLKSAPLPAAAGPAGQLVEYAGTLGPAGSNAIAENGLNPGSFRWRMLNTVGYAVGPASLSLQWQHLPAAKSIAFPFDNNTPFVGSTAYNLFNLFGSFTAADNVTFRFGVDNLFNQAPPLTEFNGSTNGLANSIGGNPINPFFFDLFGRRFFAGASLEF